MPADATAHCNLGLALADLGEFAQALQALQQGHKLGSQRPGWPLPSAAWVKSCEQKFALEKRLPQVLQGQAATPAELLWLSDLCVARSATPMRRCSMARPSLPTRKRRRISTRLIATTPPAPRPWLPAARGPELIS